MLNKHLRQEHEAMKIQNDIQRTQNDNILLHIFHWYKKNKKLKAKNKLLRSKIRNLKCRILVKKPRMKTSTRKEKITNLDVLARASEIDK